jgi:hypothetical protein
VLPISEGNHGDSSQFKPCKENNLTTWHTWATEATWVATVHDAIKESGRVLPCPSAIFHAYASVDTPWVANTIPYNNHEEVGYRPTQWHLKLLSLWDPIKSCMCRYTTQTCSSGPDDWSLTDTGGGYRLEAPNFRSDHSSSFPPSILALPLIAPSNLQLCQPFNHLAKPHRTSIDRKGPIASRFQPLLFYR